MIPTLTTESTAVMSVSSPSVNMSLMASKSEVRREIIRPVVYRS